MKKSIMLMLALLMPWGAQAEPAKVPDSKQPLVLEAWVSERASAPSDYPVFFAIQNGSRRDVLLRVETPVAERANFYQMSMAGGLMRMERLPVISVPANKKIVLAPGGRHLLLAGVKTAPKAGEKIPLTLVFRYAGKLTVQAEVRPFVPEADASAAH